MHWKRYGFLLGFLPLALPIVAWNRMETTEWQIFAWSPLVVIFGLGLIRFCRRQGELFSSRAVSIRPALNDVPGAFAGATGCTELYVQAAQAL